MEQSGAFDFMSKSPGLYQELRTCDTKRAKISRDVHRTLQKSPEEARHCPQCATLLNVLDAYATLNPRVGYCQGLNSVAAEVQPKSASLGHFCSHL